MILVAQSVQPGEIKIITSCVILINAHSRVAMYDPAVVLCVDIKINSVLDG